MSSACPAAATFLPSDDAMSGSVCKIGVGYLQKSKCPRCLGISRKARAAKLREQQARRAANKEEANGRLPDGSSFAFCYSAEEKLWRGRLTIGAYGQTFDAEASAVLRLPVILDGKYREWLRSQGGPQPEG